ncbi:uncharacterized protein HMPREF1541_07382 [Cyphellophora europaea CBS 101466]|uniref:NmrA-like domain-containing protein n=1 Tax=Cyphellophora europaea (strain CBS 101466) TaxID=1220924 RepID=W2RPV1_CYPE1|nr:uncharacterized protein HMPREF1541_07382 [Cyphellophora europaea CBS 101466]ETN37759.1 hypothetical protein HMPREF1541_07382 [Cyphellophora europaea CBS 101466]
MSSPFKVALGGAAGQLGSYVLKHLLQASHPVVVLTRVGSKTTSQLPSSPLITVAEVDYASPDTITPHLNGVHTVIATLGSTSIAAQTGLISAAASAGVSRFIPSEFGCDTFAPRVSELPVYGAKVAVQKQLKALADSQPGFTWTAVLNQAFLDSGLTNGFIADVPNHKINLYDGGDTPFSATRLDTIARAVVGVLSHLEETRNRAVYVHDIVTTQNEIVGFAKEADGQSWSVAPVDLTVLREEAYKELGKEKPDFATAMTGLVRQAAFGKGWGCDFTGKVDNELLGLKGMTKEELKAYVASYLN